MAIYYSILYPPIVPLSHPAFELTKPEDTFRIYFEPSVGNKISEFSGGFIRIRNAETEKNALLPIGDGYIDGFIPFRNPFAEYVDLIDPSKNILQPEGYNPTLPFVQQNERNEYFIDLKQEAFTLSGSQKDVRYKLQIMVTRDWVSSTADNGKGNILVYKDDQVNPGYQRIDTSQYFGGNLIQKGLSEWSSNTLIAPVSIANYELQIDGNNIFSPIVEFIGSTVDDNIRNNTMANYLKAYRINIYKAFEGRKDIFVDSSDWIIGQEASNLEIRWQNKVEFENKENYIIELDIQTAWDLRKTFTYYVYTQFEASLFKGSVKVLNDHDYARSKIIMNIQTPLQWGPRDNFDISTDDRDYAVINDEAFVQEGVDFFSDRGSLAGEMLIKGIDPIRNWHENDKRWFFKLKGPEITDKNHFQEVYSMYAHCIPLGRDKENDGPYTDDIIINPVIESPTGEVYKTYVDSSRTPEPYFDKDKVSYDLTTDAPEVQPLLSDLGGVVTIRSTLPSSHTYFYLEDDNNQLWRTTITPTGEFVTDISHEKDPMEFLKPVYFWDAHTRTLVKPTVDAKGVIDLSIASENYSLEENARPPYVNEFRFVKEVYALELGRKVKILKQTYKAYMTDFNRKLGKWHKISRDRKYYIYFSASEGQIQLVVRDLSASDLENGFDRFTLTYTGGANIGVKSDMFLTTTGVNKDFLEPKKDDGSPLPYTITSGETGILTNDLGYISASTSTSRSLRESDIEEMRNKGEIEE